MPGSRTPDPELMTRLRASVEGIAWAAGLVAEWQHQRAEAEWTPNQQVYHLLAVETRNYHVRIPRFINEDRPALVPWDNDASLAVDDNSVDIETLATRFVTARRETLAMFDALSPEQWSRTATWPDGSEVALAWGAEKVLWHSLDHLALLLDCHQEFDLLQAKRWANA